MTVVGSPQELGMVFFVTSDTPPTPTVVEPLPSKGSSCLQYGINFMTIMGYFVSLQLIWILFLLFTMPQQTGLLEIYSTSNLPWPAIAVLTARTWSDTHTHTHTHTINNYHACTYTHTIKWGHNTSVEQQSFFTIAIIPVIKMNYVL